MAADEARQPEVHDGDLPFAQRAEELFDTIAAEEGVKSEYVGALVSAVDCPGLAVNEAEVTKALHEVAQATKNRLPDTDTRSHSTSRDEHIRAMNACCTYIRSCSS